MEKHLLTSLIVSAVVILIVLVFIIVFTVIVLKDRRHDFKIELLKTGLSLQFTQHDKTQ